MQGHVGIISGTITNTLKADVIITNVDLIVELYWIYQ